MSVVERYTEYIDKLLNDNSITERDRMFRLLGYVWEDAITIEDHQTPKEIETNETSLR